MHAQDERTLLNALEENGTALRAVVRDLTNEAAGPSWKFSSTS